MLLLVVVGVVVAFGVVFSVDGVGSCLGTIVVGVVVIVIVVAGVIGVVDVMVVVDFIALFGVDGGCCSWK